MDAKQSSRADSAAPHPGVGGGDRISRRQALLGLLAIAVVALLARWTFSPPTASFDREFDGFQAGFFGAAMVNYERLGVDAFGGYPVANIDARPDEAATWYPYANHSPLLPLGLFAWMQAFGPPGWDSAWTSGVSPATVDERASGRFEATLRTPSWIASWLTILVLYWALRGAMQRAPALLATLIYALFPMSVLQVGLVNYEPFDMLFAMLTFGGVVHYLNGRPRALVLACLGAFAGAATTFAPLFMTLPLCVALLLIQPAHRLGASTGAWLRRLPVSVLLGISALAPALLHGIWAGRQLEAHALAIGQARPPGLFARIGTLFEPLLDGSVPLWTWLDHQLTVLNEVTSPLFLELTGFAALIAIIDAFARPQSERPKPLSGLGAALLTIASGVTALFFYYRHTADGITPGTPSQNTFMVHVLPGTAALAGWALIEIVATLERVLGSRDEGATWLKRCGPKGLVGIVLALLLASFHQATTRQHTALRGPIANRPLPRELGSDLGASLPAGSIGLYPASIGLTPATSFYAWRTLYPVTGDLASIQVVEGMLGQMQLRGTPLYLCLPITPAAGTANGVAEVEAFFRSMRPAVAEAEPTRTAHWRLWRIN